MYKVPSTQWESDHYTRGHKIARKCNVESLKLKKVRRVGVNIMDKKAKPLGVNPTKEGLIITEEESKKAGK